MGTHAKYQVWVGVTEEQVRGENCRFFEEAYASYKGVELDGLTFQTISMNGRTVGVGVVVSELSWTTELEECNQFDRTLCKKAEETLSKVQAIFKRLNIRSSASIYHHIDLGG